MNPWNDDYYKVIYSSDIKTGISLRFDSGIELELRKIFIDFTKWLRKNYFFPVHINVYIKNCEKILLWNGNLLYGSFRYYAQKSAHILIAAKIEENLTKKHSRKDIYEMILSSFSHELTHYFQWVNCFDQTDAESERQANYYRYRMIEKYYSESK